MLNCKSCSYFKSYFAVILAAAISVRFYPQHSSLITLVLLTGIPIIIFKKSPEELGLKNFKRGFLWGAFFSLLILPLFYLIAPEKSQFQISQAVFLIPYYLGIAVGEEVFFRGFFYSTFENESLFSFLTKNNLVSSTLFAVAHALVYYNPEMFKVFFPSLVMGFLFERSGSLLAPIIFHCLSDVVYHFARV